MKMTPKLPSDFAAFILTHGRPDRVFTYDTLRKRGYTGRIIVLIDDLDQTRGQYVERYGDEVVVFDKKAIAATFDQGDNFSDMRAIVYARNACFEVAKKLGIRNFVQLDDDYNAFEYRFNERFAYSRRHIKSNLDEVFAALVNFYESSGAHSIAMAQGGDYLGGRQNATLMAKVIQLRRKCMNSFFCSTERPFKFIGRVNEDVNTYSKLGNLGLQLFTTNQVSLEQMRTQSNSGGMTELYLDSGTYVKSFYSVMFQPSSVTVQVMRSKNPRLHHFVRWRNTAPLIVRESLRKV